MLTKNTIRFIMLSCIGLVATAAWAGALTNSSFALEAKAITSRETTLGNLVADAVRSEAKADIALVNASQMRAEDVPAGPITKAAVTSALAYPDETLAVARMSGSKVTAFLERGLSLVPQPNKGFLQVSGLQVRFDARAAGGARVLEVRVGGQPLDPDREYNVAMPTSLAKGAGGYFNIINGLQVRPLDTTISAAVESYLSARGTASARAGTPRLQDISR